MVIGIIIWGIIWGFVCCKIVENKGYDWGLWFLWGFLFSFIAAIVALSKPQATPASYSISDDDAPNKKTVEKAQLASNAGTWSCFFCGKENYNYTGTCSCGKTKQDSEQARLNTKMAAEKLQGSMVIDEMEPKSADIEITEKNPPVIRSSKNSEKKTVQTPEAMEKNIELVKQLKELLDMEAITKEEFDIKKKELLNL